MLGLRSVFLTNLRQPFFLGYVRLDSNMQNLLTALLLFIMLLNDYLVLLQAISKPCTRE